MAVNDGVFVFLLVPFFVVVFVLSRAGHFPAFEVVTLFDGGRFRCTGGPGGPIVDQLLQGNNRNRAYSSEDAVATVAHSQVVRN